MESEGIARELGKRIYNFPLRLPSLKVAARSACPFHEIADPETRKLTIDHSGRTYSPEIRHQLRSQTHHLKYFQGGHL